MPLPLLHWLAQYITSPQLADRDLKGRSVLLYDPPEEEDIATDSSDEDEEYRFRTQSGVTMPTIGAGQPVVLTVEKTKDNAMQRRVTVGRTSNNDIVLEAQSVSRFHAWLQRDEVTDGWHFSDAGSRNGSFVDNVRLSARKPVALLTGAKLRLGSVELLYFSPEGFLAFLKVRAAK